VATLHTGRMSHPHIQTIQRRIRPIDAARGSAMLFVFFSHFVEFFFRRYHLPLDLAYAVTMIASPAFLSISGIMLGILFCTRPEKYPATKSSFIRRGIFLLTVGRVLIFIAHIPISGGWQEALRWGFMTDAIGCSILVGPLLMERLGRYRRVLLGMLMYVVSWGVAILWIPVDTPAMVFKEALVGSFGSGTRFYTDVFPILPWFGLYLAATALGEYLGDQIVGGREARLIWTTLRIGMIAIGSAVSVFAFRSLLERTFGDSISNQTHMLLSPLQKLPPGPIYLLFYGGCAFLMLFVLLRFHENRAVDRYSSIVEIIGRNSLFVFIVQYFVYFALFPLLDFPKPSLWPLYFATSAAVIWGLALLWDKGKMNKYLTIPNFQFLGLQTPKR
jgi:uncharacterized membrane protein